MFGLFGFISVYGLCGVLDGGEGGVEVVIVGGVVVFVGGIVGVLVGGGVGMFGVGFLVVGGGVFCGGFWLVSGVSSFCVLCFIERMCLLCSCWWILFVLIFCFIFCLMVLKLCFRWLIYRLVVCVVFGRCLGLSISRVISLISNSLLKLILNIDGYLLVFVCWFFDFLCLGVDGVWLV